MKCGTVKREKKDGRKFSDLRNVSPFEDTANSRNERVESGKDDLEYVGEEFGSDGSLTPDQKHSQRSSSQSIDETSIETCFEDREKKKERFR